MWPDYDDNPDNPANHEPDLPAPEGPVPEDNEDF